MRRLREKKCFAQTEAASLISFGVEATAAWANLWQHVN